MKEPFFSPEAQRDLQAILDYVAKDNPTAARTLIDLVQETCNQIARLPGMGASRDDLMPSLRVFPVKKYVICYRATDDGIEIIRVVHGARDFNRLFDGDL